MFNSCAVTDEAVRQTRQAVRRALRERPDTAVVVTGCAAELEAERFAAMGARVVANDAKRLTASYQVENGASKSSARAEMDDGAPPSPFALSLSKGRSSVPYTPALSGADHARAFLGVQTGCSHSCTFCATVLARGTARSATVESVPVSYTHLDVYKRQVVIDARAKSVEMTPARAHAIADRRHGIGCDQLILLEPSSKADVKMRIFNADGSEVEACGKATRCVAKLIGKPAVIETVGGMLRVTPADGGAEVVLGEPVFDWEHIPLAMPMDTRDMPVAWDELEHGCLLYTSRCV